MKRLRQLEKAHFFSSFFFKKKRKKKEKNGQNTYANLTTCSSDMLSVNKFFIRLIRSRNKRSAANLLLSLAFVDVVVMDDIHSRNTAKICFDGWSVKLRTKNNYTKLFFWSNYRKVAKFQTYQNTFTFISYNRIGSVRYTLYHIVVACVN